ncbi:S26 family signal peptidase [Shumkonia mesophila]|uniref:S26 family signal peptidase n=1 Tax=Shumkonia mesophila TaxID=2838854 RepID=UPI002934CD6A|nr:S26 family signal peptidase [Shumkonia mesophila]
MAGLGLAALGFAAFADPVPRLIWNASASAPIGLYWVDHDASARGDLVLAELPPHARWLAAERGYLAEGMPLVKRVAALGSDTVCVVRARIFINGWPVTERLAEDHRGRPLPRWNGCRRLADDEVFLLMANVPDSFDGRYFGPVHRAAILGTLLPLWMGSTPGE